MWKKYVTLRNKKTGKYAHEYRVRYKQKYGRYPEAHIIVFKEKSKPYLFRRTDLLGLHRDGYIVPWEKYDLQAARRIVQFSKKKQAFSEMFFMELL